MHGIFNANKFDTRYQISPLTRCFTSNITSKLLRLEIDAMKINSFRCETTSTCSKYGALASNTCATTFNKLYQAPTNSRKRTKQEAWSMNRSNKPTLSGYHGYPLETLQSRHVRANVLALQEGCQFKQAP